MYLHTYVPHTSVPVLSGVEEDNVPVVLHSLHGLLQTVLLTGRCTDDLKLLQVRLKVVSD